MKSDIVIGEEDELDAESLLKTSGKEDAKEGTAPYDERLGDRRAIVVVFVLALLVLIVHLWVKGVVFGWLEWLVSGAGVAYGGRRLWRGSFESLKRKKFNHDYLVIFYCAVFFVLGSIGLIADRRSSLYLFDSIFFVWMLLVARFFLVVMRRKISAHADQLARACEGRALVRRGGGSEEVNADELSRGDMVIGEPGSAVVADGVVIRGGGEVSEVLFHRDRLITPKAPGDVVFAGSKVQSGRLEYQVTATVGDTLARRATYIIHHAQSHRGRWRKTAQTHLRLAAMIVLLLAIAIVATAFVKHQPADATTNWLLVILISAAPGLWLSSFDSVSLALTSYGLLRGIVVRDPEIALRLMRLKTVVFDKTGTVSEGKPKVKNIIAISKGATVDWVLRTAAALEARSEHPLSDAILRKWQRQVREASSLEDVIGKGIRGIVEGKRMILGNYSFMQEYNINFGQATAERVRQLEASGKTLLFLARENTQLSGIIVLEDALRPTVFEAVDKLRAGGYKTVLLTGDNVSVGKIAGQEIGADDARGGVMPAEKVRLIEKLKKESGPVLTIGSGQSDEAMVGRADVGVSNCSGRDIAGSRGQVVLLNGYLGDVIWLIKLGRAAALVLAQNFAWAYIYNAAILLMAVKRVLPLEAAIAASAAAPLVPLLNAFRVRK